MLMLLYEADPIAMWSLVAGVVAAVAAIVAAVAAIFAAVYAKAAPSKDDLKRVEEHAAATSTHLEKVHTNIARMDERLHKQYENNSLISQAERMSITVHGMGTAGESLPIDLVINDPDTALLRLELYDTVGTLFGSVECTRVEPLAYNAVLDAPLALRWFNAGAADTSNKRLLSIRAYMSLPGQEVWRHFPVYMTEGIRQVEERPDERGTVYIVDGNV